MPSIAQKSGSAVQRPIIHQNLHTIVRQLVQEFFRDELAARDFASKSDLADLELRMRDLQGDPDAVRNELVALQNSFPENATSTTRGSRVPVTSASGIDSGVHPKLGYRLKSSMWDVSLFIGVPGVDMGVSLALAACLLLNLCVVATFILLVEANLTESDFDEASVAEYKYWRATVAHSFVYRNPVTGESLASGVCQQKQSMPHSNMHILTMNDLDKYLALFGGQKSLSTGEVMCCLALLVWCFVLMAEIREILDWTLACLILPYNQHCGMVRMAENLRLVGISTWRKVLVLVFCAIRLLLVIMLFWFGMWFLVFEVSVEEMLLNSIALELVLNLDELIFRALAPDVAKRLIDRMQLLEFPRLDSAWYNYGEFIFMLLLSITVLSLEIVFSLQPFVDLLKDSREALCGGVESSLHFVVATDNLGIPWAAKTEASNFVSYTQSAIHHVKRWGFPNTTHLEDGVIEAYNTGMFMLVKTPYELQRIEANFPPADDWSRDKGENRIELVGGVSELTMLGPDTYDLGDFRNTVYNRYLGFLLGVPHATYVNCSDVPFVRCITAGHNLESVVMRQLCPSRCGCDNPIGGTVGIGGGLSAFPTYAGCAAWNVRKKRFQDTLGSLPCKDTTERNTFFSWADGLSDAISVRATFDSGGCPEVVMQQGMLELADKKDPLLASLFCKDTSLAAICPKSCGCNASSAWTPFMVTYASLMYCPLSCRRSAPLCFTVNRLNATPSRAGPYVGYACVFPFEYKGQTFTRCTSLDWPVPWCSVINYRGSMLIWGECPSSSCSHHVL